MNMRYFVRFAPTGDVLGTPTGAGRVAGEGLVQVTADEQAACRDGRAKIDPHTLAVIERVPSPEEAVAALTKGRTAALARVTQAHAGGIDHLAQGMSAAEQRSFLLQLALAKDANAGDSQALERLAALCVAGETPQELAVKIVHKADQYESLTLALGNVLRTARNAIEAAAAEDLAAILAQAEAGFDAVFEAAAHAEEGEG